MRDIKRVYIHCSASNYGGFEQINKWHRKRNFRPYEESGRELYFGYHFLILNPFANFKEWTKYKVTGNITNITDGRVIKGRPIAVMGQQVSKDNYNSVGICYVGISPTPLQLNSLLGVTIDLLLELSLSVSDVLMHHEWYLNRDLPLRKTCPNLNGEAFRGELIRRLN